VTDTLWPDFNRRELLKAVLDYQKRERRYGGLSNGQWNGTHAREEDQLIEVIASSQ
jgi:undecaprenyl diphosphate synthase